MEKLHTLTVQDFIWLNQELTGVRQGFSYALLEEAVYYQYSYGASGQVIEQAARLLIGFAKLRPFDRGSLAASFAGAVAFLRLNGFAFHLAPESAADWAKARFNDPLSATEAIKALTEKESAHHDEPSSRLVMGEAVLRYSSALKLLLETEPERPLEVKQPV